MTDSNDFHLYVLLCDKKTLYTGIAIDPLARLAQHRQGHPNGAKFTRRFDDLQIVYQVEIGSRSSAQSIEFQFKKLNKQEKLKVIENNFNCAELTSFLQPNQLT